MEVFTGVIFFIFSAFKLISSHYTLGEERRQLIENGSMEEELIVVDFNPVIQQGQNSTNNPFLTTIPVSVSTSSKIRQSPSSLLDENQTYVTNPNMEMYHEPCLNNFYKRHPSFNNLLIRWFPQISESNISVELIIASLLTCGVFSGFLGGATGTSSPPQILTFTLLDMTKGSMRGVKVFATIVSNVTRLYLFATVKNENGNGGNVDDDGEAAIALNIQEEWKAYLLFCAMSFAGATLGSYLREFIKKDVLLGLLYWLLWLTSAQLVGAFVGGLLSLQAFAFYLATGGISYLCYQCFYHPDRVDIYYELVKEGLTGNEELKVVE